MKSIKDQSIVEYYQEQEKIISGGDYLNGYKTAEQEIINKNVSLIVLKKIDAAKECFDANKSVNFMGEWYDIHDDDIDEEMRSVAGRNDYYNLQTFLNGYFAGLTEIYREHIKPHLKND